MNRTSCAAPPAVKRPAVLAAKAGTQCTRLFYLASPPAHCRLCVEPQTVTAGQVRKVAVSVYDESYVRSDHKLVFFVRPFGSTPTDHPDGPAPELNQFVPDERAGTGLYQEGVA